MGSCFSSSSSTEESDGKKRAFSDKNSNGNNGNSGQRSRSDPTDNKHQQSKISSIKGSKREGRAGSLASTLSGQGSSNGHKDNESQSGGDHSSRQEVKIVLLGSGESGKSTILKQMKILNQNGYSQEELVMYKTTVYKNLVDCAKAMVAALDKFQIDIPDRSESDDILTSSNISVISSAIVSPDPDTILDSEVARSIRLLWANNSVRQLFSKHRSEFYIMDSAPYFFESVDRIGHIDYIPNVNDVLRARIKTTGIYDSRFNMGGLNIHMYDVGGQRSERKKWIHCFDNVTVMIFCVALSEYDQVLLEEKSQNRMAESLVLFESVINSQWFSRTSVVLFLNKIDVFTEKLPYSPLENYFPDYTGGNDIHKAAKYILWRFSQANRMGLNIYPHLTQATDTSNIRLVFAAVKETILQNSLRDSGIL